ncbi:hypothetical protein, partial [Lactobacillus jensenii]|uniref:hypothetical protein n=1 Tax=Lactobacillus jensenii TaxID=109790 RepID=UPI00286FC9F8
KTEDDNLNIDVWQPSRGELTDRDFYDCQLGKEVLNADIPKLEKIIAEILELVRYAGGEMQLVADYNKTLGLLQKKNAIE